MGYLFWGGGGSDPGQPQLQRTTPREKKTPAHTLEQIRLFLLVQTTTSLSGCLECEKKQKFVDSLTDLGTGNAPPPTPQSPFSPSPTNQQFFQGGGNTHPRDKFTVPGASQELKPNPESLRFFEAE